MPSISGEKIAHEAPVLVTGASGFVGSHIARLLARQGRKVRVFLRETSKQDALDDLPVEKHYGDAQAMLLAETHGRIGERYIIANEYLIRSDAIFPSVAFAELDSSKARRELHWQQRPMAETVRDASAWFRTRKNAAQIEMEPIPGRW